MSGVSFGLADFHTGGPIQDLPIKTGASWATSLNKPDSLSCTVSLRDPAVKALDLRSSSEVKKTLLVARNEDGDILAAGVISDRDWDDDKGIVDIEATGVWEYFNNTLIGPATARDLPLVLPNGSANPALDTNYTNLSLGTMGKRLVEQRLTWPGSPTIFILPAEELGQWENAYPFSALKMVGSALSDLTKRENGVDFAFDASIAPDGLSIQITMRHGSTARPMLGTKAGSWSVGVERSPVTGLKVNESGADMATAGWMSGGKSNSSLLMSRALNEDLRINSGIPPLDFVDTSHSDVVKQATLDDYNADNLDYASGALLKLSFDVRANAPGLALGSYRVGDWVDLIVGEHPRLPEGEVPVRITGISGDERAKKIKIACTMGPYPYG